MAAGNLTRLISALSAECDDLSMRVDDMHGLLSLSSEEAEASAGFMTAAQDIDYVQQHLAALAEFLMELAEWTPSDIMVDIDGPLHGMRLSALRARLSGGDTIDAPPLVRAGELELL